MRLMARIDPDRWVPGLTGIAAAAASVVIALWRPAHVTVLHAGLIVVSLWIVGGGCLWWFARRERMGLPLFPVSLIAYLVVFLLSLYAFPTIWPPGAEVIFLAVRVDDLSYFGSIAAMAIVVVGLAGYVIGFVAARENALGRLPHFRLPRVYPDHRLALLAWAMLLGHACYVFIPAVQALPSVGQLLIPAGLIAFTLFCYLGHARRISRAHAAVALTLIVAALVYRLLTQWALTPIILFALTGFFLYIYLYRRIPVVIVVVTFVFFAFTYQSVQFYRTFKYDPRWPERSEGLGLVSDAVNVGRLAAFFWFSPTGDLCETRHAERIWLAGECWLCFFDPACRFPAGVRVLGGLRVS